MVGLPDDEDGDEMTVEKRMDSDEVCDVKVAGVDIAASDEDGEKGSQKMDVDV